jgi:8-oxo-dGTP diphosphatase
MKVVVGIVYNPSQHILVAKRPDGKHLAGFWEFPGGKIETNES